MKRPARIPAQLPVSLHKRLNAYALAATATGVGVLAMARPAAAEIIYTPTHQVIGPNSNYNLDLNNDGTTDFFIRNTFNCSMTRCRDNLTLGANNGNSFEGHRYDFRPFALKRGATIGASRLWSGQSAYMAWALRYASQNLTFTSGGAWANVTNRYLGLKFTLGHERHYGWARLNVKIDSKTAKITATLTGYAYETIPIDKIIAGKTHGRDDATLGRLAQGASGVLNGGKP